MKLSQNQKSLLRDVFMVLIAASIPASVSFYTIRAQFKNDLGNKFAETQHIHYQEVCASMAAFNAAFESCAANSLERQLLDLSSQVSATRALPPNKVLESVTNLADIVLRSVTNDINVPAVGEVVVTNSLVGQSLVLRSASNNTYIPTGGSVVITNFGEGSSGSTNDINNSSNTVVRIIVTEHSTSGTISEVVKSHFITTKPVIVKPGERDTALGDAYNQKVFATRHALMAARPYFSKKVQDHIGKILEAPTDPYCIVPKSAFSNEFKAAVTSDDPTALIGKVRVEQHGMIEAQGYFESQSKLLLEMEAELVIKDK